ncbi:CRISPR-associated endonuclease Cas2 [Roseospira goensis]|uniref:CRISPR-associated endoribonuclease Cas2 n=1 Tax=Roseospira goensis TaxID=391922 RepID=A0A7W6RY82_9PROT|nr:CRISPR-associated protein Cas2 [Roseospira goensis]
MSRTEMLMVFCYDIARAAARRRVAAVLEDHATRVQKSVFEARMTPSRADRLAREAAVHLEGGDSLRVYAVSADGRPHCAVHGTGTPLAEDQDFWLL